MERTDAAQMKKTWKNILISTAHEMSGMAMVLLRIKILGSVELKAGKLVHFCQWLIWLLFFFPLDQPLYNLHFESGTIPE